MRFFAWMLSCLSLVAGSAGAVSFNFDKDGVGSFPKGLTQGAIGNAAEAKWEVRTESQAPSRPNILAQVGHAGGGPNYSVLWFDGLNLVNGQVNFSFKTKGGEDAPGAGVVWRYQDEKNYYKLQCSSKHDECHVVRAKKGKLKVLTTMPVIVTADVWHTLRLVFAGPAFMAYIDGELAVGEKDKKNLEPGKVGILIQSDSVTYFDDVKASE